MERRHFLKVALGFAAGAAALAASARAAPLAPHPLTEDGRLPPAGNEKARPAVVTGDEVNSLKPEEVHWHRHWHGGWHRHWHRRHWGWRGHRHWGWHRRRWHHRHWRRRYW